MENESAPSTCKNGISVWEVGRIESGDQTWKLLSTFKDEIMLDIIRSKFNHPQLRKMLSDTSTRYLFEGNNWHDTYWGVCDGQHVSAPKHSEPIGENKLGKILERVRFEIWEMRGVPRRSDT